MTSQTFFSLAALMTGATSDISQSGISKPAHVKILTGEDMISRERRKFSHKQASSTDFLIASALAVIEMSAYDPDFISESSLERGLTFLLESFQLDLIDLCKKQQELGDDVEQSRKFLKEKSAAHEENWIGYAPAQSIADAFLFKPYTQSRDFRYRASLIDERFPQSRGVTRKLVAELRRPKKFKFRAKHFAARLLSPSHDFLTETQRNITQHVGVLEREAKIRLLQTQIQRFYAWRNSDDYKKVIHAYGRILRDEKRIETKLKSTGPQ